MEVVPKNTAHPDTKFVPVIATDGLPATSEIAGETETTAGAGSAKYMKPFVNDADCGPGTVTATVAYPAVPEGVVQVIVEELTTTMLVARTPPKVTVVAGLSMKLVPVTVTLFPPVDAP